MLLSTLLEQSRNSLEIIVYGICTGAIIAFTLYFFRQRLLGTLVKRLILDALGAENAKTLDELGKNKLIYRHALGDNSILRRYVSVIGDTLPLDVNGKPDFSSARFYITDDKTEIAISRYHKECKIYVYVLGVLAMALLAFAVRYLIPLMLNLIG